jgi:two-component system nitrogen regulation response regulator NtrX
MNGTWVGWKQESLFKSVAVLARGVASPREALKTIVASFESAATGLNDARGGLFLLRYHPESLGLEVLCSAGLPERRIRAIELDKDLQDNAARQIWMTASRLMGAPGDEREQSHEILQRVSPTTHVLCVPIFDPVLEVPAAILYLETETGDDPEFEAIAKNWITNYASALGQIIHVGFARETSEDRLENTEIKTVENGPKLIGASVQTQALRNDLHELHIPAASSREPDPILILGEKGTGKDLVARYIHAYSSRRNRPYVAVNCAEITDELATARFFGHKKGSFTGSLYNEPGLFRAADSGVLFLDEIAELSLRAQGTLLRVLENRTVVAIGETKEQRVDVQVILGTNRDPEEAAAQGLIRPDLLDRFRTNTISLVPLRERPWDIPALVQHFIEYHETRTQKKPQVVPKDVLKIMAGYSWPGNVRELARVCSLLVTHLKPGAPLDAGSLRRLVPYIANGERNPRACSVVAGDMHMREALDIFGRELILARLRQHNWNVKAARESLGLPKTTFHRYTRTLGIAGAIRGEKEIEYPYESTGSAVKAISALT